MEPKDRTARYYRIVFTAVAVLVVLALAIPFVSAARAGALDEERFPESRFGQPPARVDLGVGPGYTAREADELDSGDPLSARPRGRGPASIGANALQARDGKTAERLKGVQEIALIASDLGYFPKTFFVTRDIPVRLFVTGASKDSLCIMLDEFSVRKQVRLRKVEEISFTPTIPGKYRFYCPIKQMEGVMIVKELGGQGAVDRAE